MSTISVMFHTHCRRTKHPLVCTVQCVLSPGGTCIQFPLCSDQGQGHGLCCVQLILNCYITIQAEGQNMQVHIRGLLIYLFVVAGGII